MSRVDDDIGSRSRQLQRDGPADAARCSRHDGDLLVERFPGWWWLISQW
jgi:hypothetical protein